MRRLKRLPNPLVVALLYDGLCTFEFACAAEVFGLPRPELLPHWYRFKTCGLRRSIRGQFGLQIEADGGLELLQSAGTIVIPGWKGIDEPVPPRLLAALRAAHARGARLLSICSGAFVLAATGLLDGRRAATHWRYAQSLRQQYPRVEVDANVLYVDEGHVLTSAGSAAGLDLFLHLIRHDFGPEIANHVARRLVIPPHRDGGQAQFLERPIQKYERNALSQLIDTLRRRLDESFSVSDLSRMASMSERTFMRRFKSSTGMTPSDWLTVARVDRARELLESSRLSIDQIASQTGLGTATTLRHHFRRKLGVSPTGYRDRFRRHARVT